MTTRPLKAAPAGCTAAAGFAANVGSTPQFSIFLENSTDFIAPFDRPEHPVSEPCYQIGTSFWRQRYQNFKMTVFPNRHFYSSCRHLNFSYMMSFHFHLDIPYNFSFSDFDSSASAPH